MHKTELNYKNNHYNRPQVGSFFWLPSPETLHKVLKALHKVLKVDNNKPDQQLCSDTGGGKNKRTMTNERGVGMHV